MLFLHKQLYDAVKLFDLQTIAVSTLYLHKLDFVFTSSLCNYKSVFGVLHFLCQI